MTEEFVPAFNFDGELTSQEEVDSLLEDANKPMGGRVFRPGDHKATVSGVKLYKNNTDAGWMNVHLSFEGAGDSEGKLATTFQLVPVTTRLSYSKADGSTSGYPLKSFIELMGNLGIEANRNNIKDIVLQYFTPANLDKLVGREAILTIGYRGAHTKWVSTGEKEGYIAIEDRGDLVKGEDGEVMRFSGDEAYKAAAAYCATKGIKFEAFPDIVGMAPTAANSGDSVVGGDF